MHLQFMANVCLICMVWNQDLISAYISMRIKGLIGKWFSTYTETQTVYIHICCGCVAFTLAFDTNTRSLKKVDGRRREREREVCTVYRNRNRIWSPKIWFRLSGYTSSINNIHVWMESLNLNSEHSLSHYTVTNFMN